MSEYVSLSSTATNIGYHVYDLGAAQPLTPVDGDSCLALQYSLDDARTQMVGRGLIETEYDCDIDAAFFFAHDTPRCALRVRLSDRDNLSLENVLAVDVDGQPIDGYEANCGNGVLDPGEECDDGNHDDWDRCDASCQRNGFNGCETVIQYYFDSAKVAHVDATTWRSPRSHLMVHDSVAPRHFLDGSLCDTATVAAQNTCSELVATMPFIRDCQPLVEFSHDDGDSCSVRFDVKFGQVSPENAVFTTQLGGVLAFSIR